MRTRTPLELQGPALEGHPALRAWNGLAARHGLPVTVEVWRERKPTSIYRFLFEDGGAPPIFAKHCDAQSGAVQRRCLEDMLPRMPIAAPRYHGAHRDPDGTWWLFVEDAGREVYSVDDPEQRRLAGRWIGALHRHGAQLPGAVDLPPAGIQRFEAHLRSGQALIHRSFSNPALSDVDRDLLREIVGLLDRVESRWAEFERALDGAPLTLVHGDFQPKNIRIGREAPTPSLFVFDWEMAGWGLPAVDLAPANGRDLRIQVDLDSYLAEVALVWPRADASAIEKQVALGHVLRRLAAVDWASHSLRFERADYLSDPIASLQSILHSLARAVEQAEEHLS